MGGVYSVREAADVKQGFGEARYVTTYDPVKMSSSTLFLTFHGTVLQNLVLWAEQLLLLAIYGAVCYVANVMGACVPDGESVRDNGMPENMTNMSESANGTALRSTSAASCAPNPWFSVSGIEGFVGCMSTLAAFTLSMYTSIILGRYWTMRTDGIGQTWGACRELCFWLPEIVTRDPEINRTIRRYARASLAIAFMERRPGSIEHNVKSELVTYELLTKEEARSILAVGSCYSRVLWSWIAAIIEKLGQNQTIETPSILGYLMAQVERGRRGLEVIGTHMSVQVPLPVVHLLGFLIKLHNLIMAVCYGYMVAACGCDFGFNTVKVFLIPFLYNGLLAINAELADPFDGGVNDFPFKMYEQAMEAEGQAFYEAGENRPDFIDQSPALKLK